MGIDHTVGRTLGRTVDCTLGRAVDGMLERTVFGSVGWPAWPTARWRDRAKTTKPTAQFSRPTVQPCAWYGFTVHRQTS